MSEGRMTTVDVLGAIARERVRLLKGIDALGDRAATVAVTQEGWTAKEVLAHLIHWATQVAFGLGAPVQPPVYMMEERRRRSLAGLDDAMPGGEESNALAVAHYRASTLGDVRAAFERVVDALVAQAGARTDAQMNATDAVPWAGNRALWEFIGGDTFLHWPLHADDIERAALRNP